MSLCRHCGTRRSNHSDVLARCSPASASKTYSEMDDRDAEIARLHAAVDEQKAELLRVVTEAHATEANLRAEVETARAHALSPRHVCAEMRAAGNPRCGACADCFAEELSRGERLRAALAAGPAALRESRAIGDWAVAADEVEAAQKKAMGGGA